MRYALQGKEMLREYFLSEEYKSRRQSIESKIVLLGNGAVGKTCLAHALMNNFFDSEQKKTDGIDIYVGLWRPECVPSIVYVVYVTIKLILDCLKRAERRQAG